MVLLRCNSSGPLYSVPSSLVPVGVGSPHSSLAAVRVSPELWHRRLGHPGSHILHFLLKNQLVSSLSCNLNTKTLCHACQLGKHTKLPFSDSVSFSVHVFDLVHSDVWTSPIVSFTGYKYYVLFLDDYSHYCWVYPLRHKSEVFDKFCNFHQLIDTQFGTKLKNFQCDGGTEYLNNKFRTFFESLGIHLRVSCLHNKMGKLSVCIARFLIWFVLFFFKPPCHLNFGWKLCKLLCTL
jgi:hypothetical protein